MKDKRLAIIFLTVFVDLVGFGIIIPLNPYLAERYGATPLDIGLLMSVYSFMQFIFAPIWGRLSDRYGRRPIILVSLFGSALSHTMFAFAPHFWGLMVARALAGVFGGNISTAMAYMADITEEKKRSQAMGLIGAAFGLGFLLGPFLGGVFADVGKSVGAHPPLNESFPALVAGAICFVNFLMAIKFLPESLPESVRQDRTRAAAAKTSRFKKIFSALGTPTLGIVLLLVFINTFAMAHIEAPLFLVVQQKWNWSLTQASFGFAYIGLILVFTQGYLIRKFLPRYGERRLLFAGFLLLGLGFALVAKADQLSVLAIAVTLIGLGNGLTNPALNGSVSLLSEKDEQGRHLGVSQSLSSLARILGPASGGFLYQQYGAGFPFMVAAGLIFAGLAISWTVRHVLPEKGKI